MAVSLWGSDLILGDDDISQLKGYLWHLGGGAWPPCLPPLKSASGCGNLIQGLYAYVNFFVHTVP